MMKNDYRRALILLRAARQGVTGHVRLERRTLTGSMQFVISGLHTTRPLQAVMAARTANGWRFAQLGTLGADAQGRAGLNWAFDPRSIEGLPLEKYSVLLVLERGEDGCRVLLTGYVNGSVQVDWERVEQEACESWSGQSASKNAPDAAECMPGEIDAADDGAPQSKISEPDADEDDMRLPAAMPVLPDTDACGCPAADPDAPLPGTTPIFAQADACDRPAADAPGMTAVFAETDACDRPAADASGMAAVLMDTDACDRPAADPPCMAAVFAETDACDRPAEAEAENTGAAARFVPEGDLDAPAGGEEDAPLVEDNGKAAAETAGGGVVIYTDPLDVPARAAQTALEALGLDAEASWPEGIEPLREAFAASEPVFLAAQPDHVFVMAAHPADCPACAVGVRAEEGRPISVAYAIPGELSETPPEGLEGYLWREGWWIAVADARTGAYLHI